MTENEDVYCWFCKKHKYTSKSDVNSHLVLCIGQKIKEVSQSQVKRLLMKTRDDIEKSWIERFIEINNRKPNRLEKISWRVGFECGYEYKSKEVPKP